MKNKGITLIALIITIIVMLILVAVTISMAVNGGLFRYAGNATKDTEIAKQEEQNLANVESGLSTDELIEKFTEGENTGETFSAIYQETAEYKENGVTTAWIPKGFAVGTSDGINNVANGLVIRDDQGNEFVWIPVNYPPSGNVDSNGLDSGFLDVFKRSAWSNNARSTDYTTNTKYKENASYDPTGKYNEMMLSVQEHKGFYIGRYEAGEIENGKIVVKRDKRPFTNVKWGESMTEIGRTGAVYLSQNMYTGDDYNVTSTLCYGVQWDAMLDFIINNDNGIHNVTSSVDWGNYTDTNADVWKITRRTAEYYKNGQWNAITEDLTKAVAGNVKLTTGANDNFQAKNIFDVAGGVYEWTMEVDSSTYRVSRGGYFYYDGDDYPASHRLNFTPAYSSTIIGFRPTLYL